MQALFPKAVKATPERLGDNYDMRNDWLERRLAELAHQGKSKSGLARALRLAPARVTEILKGDRKIQLSEVKIVSTYLDWPDARVIALVNRTPIQGARQGGNVNLNTVTVKGAVRAGLWAETLEWLASEWFEVLVPLDPAVAKLPVIGLLIEGPSMNQVYADGTIVICVSAIHLEGYEFQTGNRVIVQRRNVEGQFEATVKEYAKDASGRAWLWPKSNHPDYQTPWPVPDRPLDDDSDDLRISALVVGQYQHEQVDLTNLTSPQRRRR